MTEKFYAQIKVFKKCNSRAIRNLGFTLIEVLIALVLLGVGLSFSAKVFVSGKYFMRQAENKARAMEIANIQMNKYLTSSYEQLGDVNATHIYSGTDPNGLAWTVTVNITVPAAGSIPPNPMPKVAPKLNDIPYKTIEVVVSYTEKGANGLSVNNSVRLFNMVVYPKLHLESLSTSPVMAVTTNPTAILTLDGFKTLVYTKLIIFYNISIDVTNSSNIGATDLILTDCRITGTNPARASSIYYTQTGTPIMTQPTINNTMSVDRYPSTSLVVNYLPPGEYRIEILWWKDHARGEIKGKKANLVIYQVEA